MLLDNLRIKKTKKWIEIRSRNERCLGQRPEFLSEGTAIQRGTWEMPTTVKSYKNSLSVNV